MTSFKKLGDDVVKYRIIPYLLSYELRKLLVLSKYFVDLLSPISNYDNNSNDLKYWQYNLSKYYGNYGVWRRGWIDLSKGIFEGLSNDDIKQFEYYLLRYKNKNEDSNKKIMIPNDINSLYLYNHRSKPKEVDKKFQFLSSIIQFESHCCELINFNCIREIYLMNSNLKNKHINIISNSLLNRNIASKLELLIIHSNKDINQISIKLLFKSIGINAPNFKNIDISSTNCNGDLLANIIYNFYYKYKNQTILQKINMDNLLKTITKKGIKRLQKIITEKLVPEYIQNEFMIRTQVKTIHYKLFKVES